MADKKTALLGLWKQVEGSMNAAGLSPVKAEKSGDVLTNDGTHDVLSYAGEAGEVRLEYANGVLDIIGSNGEETKSLGTLLFEAESDDWGVKDIRSAANEVGETVADFFGTTFVTASSSEKAQKTKNAKAAEAAAAAPAPKKKKSKKNVDAFEPVDLIYRLEAIFPEYAGKADENEARYGTFLPEEYLQENPKLLEDILLAIRMEDKNYMKRLFKTFSTYYEDGEKDTQSLIAVSLLGMGAAKEEGLLPIMEQYASEDLFKVVDGIAKYLNTGKGKKALKKYADPKPYKESLKERWGKQGLQQAASQQMLDGSDLTGKKK